MEANREAAVQCVARAETALLENDFARALRLFVKAQSLYPLEGLATKIEAAQAFQDGAAQQQQQSQSQQAPPPPQAPPQAPPRPPSPPPAPYVSTTPSDAEVDRVLCSGGCHYAVLGLARTVLAADLKKNYHKLCLRLHPDKAAHPQATQAFQLVQAAFAVLKEPVERAAYDIRSRVPSAAEARAAREARAGPGYSARQAYNPPPPPPPPPPPSSLMEALQRELVRCTVDELKRMCGRLSPSPSKTGNKTALIDRMARHKSFGTDLGAKAVRPLPLTLTLTLTLNPNPNPNPNQHVRAHAQGGR